MKIYVRDKILCIDHTIKEKRYRFSTGKINNPQTRGWLEKNIENEFNRLKKLQDLKANLAHQQQQLTPTLEIYAQKSFKLNKNYRRPHTTKDNINKFNLHIKPIFGDKKLDTITISQIKQWQNYLIDIGLSIKYIKNIRSIFSVILTNAIEDGFIIQNVIKKVQPPKKIYNDDNKYEINPFNAQEIEMLINTATGQFKSIITILFFTGIRLGELVTLKPNDVNFDRNIIKIQRANQKDGTIGLTKTGKIREIDILPPVLNVLKTQLENNQNEFIFTTQYNERYITYNTLRDYHWRKLLKACNLTYRPLYQCRHTFASIMLSNNENLLWVSNMLGHSEITTTLKFYSKYIPSPKINKAEFLKTLNIK